MAAPEQQAPAQTPKRQYVNFAFYKLDPAWRRLPEDERAKGKQEFIRAVEDYAGKVLVIPYSTVGIRGDCDLMLWRISYELEYGVDTLEIHKDAVKPGMRIVIADDLLATGGTSLATVRLAEKLGGNVVAVSFVIELEALKGRDRLNGYEVVSLLKY